MNAASLHVFRVEEGLGNACLLELPDGTFGIVDWGTENDEQLDVVISLVRKSRFRFVVASHAHNDHTLGLEKLITRSFTEGIVVEKFLYPASSVPTKPGKLKKTALVRARLAVYHAKIPSAYVAVNTLSDPNQVPPTLARGKDWEVRLLAPPDTTIGTSEIKSGKQGQVPGNDTSLVIGFRFLGPPAESGVGRVLLPGDATKATLDFARRTASRFPDLSLNNQAFVAPHHGSSDGLPEWLYRCLFGVVIISAPTNSSHHPGKNTLIKIAKHCCSQAIPQLFCTSYAGTCATEFRNQARDDELHLVDPGPCFGDVAIRIPPVGVATLDGSSHAGQERRRFGHCGHPSAS
jgi:beta-lactamase superfamily II metal-dependent hydrolase